MNHKLRMLAAHLPPYPKLVNGQPQYTRVVVDGSDVIEKHGNGFKIQGKVVEPSKKYLMPVAILANHFDELQKAWRASGHQGVNDYCNRVRSFNQQYTKDHEQKQQDKKMLPNPEDAFGTEPKK